MSEISKHPTTNIQQPTSNGRISRTAGELGIRGWMLVVGCWIAVLLLLCALHTSAATITNRFNAGLEAYRAGDFAQAAQVFRNCAAAEPASGALQNLGNAEWQRGRAGQAILAWEQALWVNPFDANARNNLRFARETTQIEAPELTWYEVGSAWLPAHWWAWIAAGSLWLVAGAMTLPTILRWRKSPSQQAAAALGLAIFLLSIPAHVALVTRSRVGFVLEKDTPLRLTPTVEAEAVAKLAAGEPGRRVRARGNYLFIRTSRGAGWVERDQFGLICSQ